MKDYVIFFNNLKDRWAVAEEDPNAEDFRTYITIESFDDLPSAKKFANDSGAAWEMLK